MFQFCIIPDDSIFMLFSYDSMLVVPDDTTIYISSSMPQCTVFVRVLPDTFSAIQGNILPSGVAISVSPNPFNARCGISVSTPSPANLNIYGTAGRLIESYSVPSGKSSVVWDASAEESGVYTAKVEPASGQSINLILLK